MINPYGLNVGLEGLGVRAGLRFGLAPRLVGFRFAGIFIQTVLCSFGSS
jgi:hypothetical protein